MDKHKITIASIFGFVVLAVIFFYSGSDSDMSEEVVLDEQEEISAATIEEHVVANERALKSIGVSESYQDGVFRSERKLFLPENLEISVFAGGMNAPRSLDFSDPANVFVTDIGAGEVKLLRDNDGDGVAEEIVTVDRGLRRPHGIDLHQNDLYVGEENQVVVYRNLKNDGTFERKEIIIRSLPFGAGHSTRTVKIGPDEKIYVSVGSSCNVCVEKDERRAAMLRYNLGGSFDRIIASGLRNTVGFTFRETENGFEIWGVDNGRDRIGDNLPPEEINLIYVSGSTEAKNFGWPYCFGNGINNPEFPNQKDFCQTQTEFPSVNMQAHSAPLGIEFFGSDMLVAFHGSWNRSEPTGYKIVKVRADGQVEDYVSGWLESSGQAWGRPVDLKFDAEGNLFVTDDEAGVVYRIKK